MNDIPFTPFTFRLTARAPMRLPAFSGSALRGGFGMALRRACCTMGSKDCRECLLKNSCVYACVFESVADRPGAGNYRLKDYPRPFVIEPPFPFSAPIEKGETFSCGVVLFGDSIRFLPFFVHAFSQLGRFGLGRERAGFIIESVQSENPDGVHVIFDGGDEQFTDSPDPRSFRDFFRDEKDCRRLSLMFETPTRVKHRNHLTKDLSFHLLMKTLFRRFSLMAQVCEAEAGDLDYKGLLRQAEEITCAQSHLYWFDWKRYSGRQKEVMKLGGFMGEITFEGELSPFLPFLRLGEFLHIGKACTFGLGKFRIVSAEL